MDAEYIDQTPPEITSDNRMNEPVSINEPPPPRFSDALLDLDESDFAASAIPDDVVLDLDLDVAPTVDYQERSWDLAPTPQPEVLDVTPDAFGEEAAMPPEDANELLVEAHPSAAEDAPTAPLASSTETGLSQPELSPEVINAIARRVIEQMSDKVVREIAWEVVPELSELMIRKKLDQK